MSGRLAFSTIAAALRARVRMLGAVRSEQGWVLVIALTVMTVMLGFGAAILAIAGTQAQLGGTERQRDAGFALADAGLNAEMFKLSQNWPLSAGAAFPTCTDTSTDSRCPTKTLMQSLINSPDTAKRLTWRFDVYDNGSVNPEMQYFYSDAKAATEPHYDAGPSSNGTGDGKLWVRAEVTVGSVTKAVVALVQTQINTFPLPYAAVVTGSLATTNQGAKVIIDTQGSASAGAPVYVRCIPPGTPSGTQIPGCITYRTSPDQIQPDTTTSYANGSAFSTAQLLALKSAAASAGTYYATCPASLPNAAKIIWIDSGTCSYTSNQVINSAATPGMMILNSATLSLAGSMVFNGLIYALNSSPLLGTGIVLTFGGTVVVNGAVMVDGLGQIAAGSSGQKVGGTPFGNIHFNPAALATAQTVSNVDYIQSTWRQLL